MSFVNSGRGSDEKDLGTAEGPHENHTEPGDIGPGTVVGGRYRVIRALGQGGMGAVYEALHLKIEKRVALKVLHPSFAGDSTLRERFLREARAAARIGHPNIVDITDFGATETGIVFIVMELLEGEDLGSVLARGAPTWEVARAILLQICRALAAAHDKGIIHRDIKPENVFLVPREHHDDLVKVVDFGIAKLLHDRNQPKLTAAGVVHGTPGFMAPEQIRGGAIDHRADVYAVGVLAYKMVTGSPPFSGSNVIQVLTQQMSQTPQPPSQIAAQGLPAELDAVILAAMDPEVDRRIGSMRELAEKFSRIGGGSEAAGGEVDLGARDGRLVEPPTAAPFHAAAVEPRGQPGHHLPAVVFLAVTVVAASFGAYLVLGGLTTERPHPTVDAVDAGPGSGTPQRDMVVRPDVSPPAVASPDASRPAPVRQARQKRHRALRKDTTKKADPSTTLKKTPDLINPYPDE